MSGINVLHFNEEQHRYYDDNNNTYLSVTQLVHKIIPSFEDSADFWALYKSIQYNSRLEESAINNFDISVKARANPHYSAKEARELLKYALRSKNYDDLKTIVPEYIVNFAEVVIKQSWEDKRISSAERGTLIHKEKELKDIGDKLVYYKGQELTVQDSSQKNIILQDKSIYNELRISNSKYRIAGTIDRLIVGTKKRLKIEDFKSNQEIKFSNKYQTLLQPLQHLPNCNYIHYCLQLSIYNWMLVQLGYQVLEREIIHISSAGNEFPYDVPYFEEEVEILLNTLV